VRVTTAKKDAYLSNPAIVPSAGVALTLSQIMLQKYIALYGWGMHETWVDMRRYHYTDLDPATGKQVYSDLTLLAALTYLSITTTSQFIGQDQGITRSTYITCRNLKELVPLLLTITLSSKVL
jgi:hypothetical protein